MSLPTAGAWNYVVLKGFFQPEPLCDSMEGNYHQTLSKRPCTAGRNHQRRSKNIQSSSANTNCLCKAPLGSSTEHLKIRHVKTKQTQGRTPLLLQTMQHQAELGTPFALPASILTAALLGLLEYPLKPSKIQLQPPAFKQQFDILLHTSSSLY